MTDPTQQYVQRLEALRTDRSNFDAQWEEAAARCSPAHVNLFTARVGVQQGEKKTDQQFDGTTAAAAHKFQAVMESLVTPQHQLWHGFKVMDKALKRNRAVRMFFDELSDCLYDYRYRPIGNFVGNSQQVYHSLGVWGNGTLFIDKPENGKGLRYRNIFLGETYFAENHAGIIDTLYRLSNFTAEQIVSKWGDKASDQVKEAAKQPTQKDRKFEVLHVVMPNTDWTPGMILGSGAMPFISIHLEVAAKKLLQTGGYDSFPYAIARYTQISGEVYGRGPAQYVLPSIKTLNEQKKTVLIQGHRATNPVLLAHDDGKLGSAQLRAGKLVPGGLNKDGKRMIDTLPAGNIAVGDKMMEMERVIIHDAFLISLFQILVDTPTMTATEVLERAREKGMLLAPTAGRLQAEFLGPMIERELTLLAKQDLFPQMPQILREYAAEYKIEYENPMSRMAKSERASGFLRALSVAGEYTKMTGDVRPLDFFNFDVAMPAILDIQGAPIAWTNSMEEVQAMRDGRAEQAQTEQAIEAAPAVAGIMKAAPGIAKGMKPAA